MGTTPDLGIPELSQSQANPDITHNEALVLIQALMKGVRDKDLSVPPVSPTEGDSYIVGAAPSGAWASRANSIAIFWGGAWRFLPGRNDAGTIISMGARQEGMRVWVQDENLAYVWAGSPQAWVTENSLLDDIFVLKAGDTMTGPLGLPLGSVGTPALVFGGGAGFFAPSTVGLRWASGGVAYTHFGTPGARFGTYADTGLTLLSSGGAFQFGGTNNIESRFHFAHFAANATGPTMVLGKSRGTSGAPGAVLNLDTLALFSVVADDGTNMNTQAGSFYFQAGANWASSKDARLFFAVCLAGVVTTGMVQDPVTGLGWSGAGAPLSFLDTNRHFRLRGYATGSLPAAANAGSLNYDTTRLKPVFDTGAALKTPVWDNGDLVTGTYQFSNAGIVIANNAAPALQAFGGITPQLQQHGVASSGFASMGFARWSNDNGGPFIYLGKSRGTAVGTHAAAQSTDSMSIFGFFSDGAAFNLTGGRISIVSGGDWTSAGTRDAFIQFSTATAGSVTEKFRLAADGSLQMGGKNNIFNAARGLQLRGYATGSLPAAATDGLTVYDTTRDKPVFDTGAALRTPVWDTGDTMTGSLTLSNSSLNWTKNNAGAPIVMSVESSGGVNSFFQRFTTDDACQVFASRKARGSIAVPTVISQNDQIFFFTGAGYDGATYRQVFQLRSLVVAATPSATDMENNLLIELAAAASVAPTEIARFAHASGLSMFGANPVITQNRVFRARVYTVGTLPAGTQGDKAHVSDSLAPVFGAAVVGGGAVSVPVYYTGAAWFVG